MNSDSNQSNSTEHLPMIKILNELETLTNALNETAVKDIIAAKGGSDSATKTASLVNSLINTLKKKL